MIDARELAREALAQLNSLPEDPVVQRDLEFLKSMLTEVEAGDTTAMKHVLLAAYGATYNRVLQSFDFPTPMMPKKTESTGPTLRQENRKNPRRATLDTNDRGDLIIRYDEEAGDEDVNSAAGG